MTARCFSGFSGSCLRTGFGGGGGGAAGTGGTAYEFGGAARSYPGTNGGSGKNGTKIHIIV